MGMFNDALNNFLGSVGEKLGGVVSGRNPLTQPNVAELFGFNIQGAPLISTRDYFLNQLESWITSIPLQSQWIVLIQPFPACINTQIMQGLEFTGGDSKNFAVDEARRILTAYPLQKVNGCMFAQNVTTPSETMSVKTASVQNNRGFLPGLLSDGRSFYNNKINIDFLETNTSFSDFIIRPWVIAGEHFGFVARENDTDVSRDIRNVKSTMYIMEYSRTFQNVSMIPKKVWTFFNCAPISVDSYSLSYNEPSEVQKIKTTWSYTNYAVANSLYLPLPNIIQRVSDMFKGKFPSLSPFQNGTQNLQRNIAAYF